MERQGPIGVISDAGIDHASQIDAYFFESTRGRMGCSGRLIFGVGSRGVNGVVSALKMAM